MKKEYSNWNLKFRLDIADDINNQLGEFKNHTDVAETDRDEKIYFKRSEIEC